MYLVLKDSEDRFIWDDTKKIMYQINGEDAYRIKPSIEQLSRFRPRIVVEEKSKSIPKGIVIDDSK